MKVYVNMHGFVRVRVNDMENVRHTQMCARPRPMLVINVSIMYTYMPAHQAWVESDLVSDVSTHAHTAHTQ